MGQTSANKRLMTVNEYLRFEEKSKFKHEYMDGEVFRLQTDTKNVRDFQLAGNRINHVSIVSNVSFFARLALREKRENCLVGTTEMRVLLRDEHYAYPDVFIVCGEPFLVPDIFDTLTNPSVLFEVLSKSTEARDRGDKAIDYRNLSSVTDYILISQNKMRVEQQTRNERESWTIKIFESPTDKVILEKLEIEINLKDIYENIKFPVKPNLQLVANKGKK